MGIDYDKIKRLIGLVEANQLTELAVEEDGLSITVKAEQEGPAAAAAVPPGGAGAHIEVRPGEDPVARTAPPVPRIEEIAAEHLFKITAPMIGVYYRTSSPDAPSYIEVGDEIEEGQTIGLIEAMKVFSEIPSEVAGRVIAIPVENAKLVQQDEVLVVVDISGD